MAPDLFGDLRQPSAVLAKLEAIFSRNSLDEHQVGLARILRYKQNPSLIEAALEYSGNIKRASDVLIAEALNVLVSQDLPTQTRALAARVLGYLLCHHPADAVSDFDIDRVIESMVHVLSSSQSSTIKQSLFRAVSAARRSANRRRSTSPFKRTPNDSPA